MDDLIDIVFVTTQDVETSVAADTGKSVDEEAQVPGGTGTSSYEFTPSDVIQEVRERVVDSLGKQLGVGFIKKSRALYWDPDHRHRIVCTVSKRYSTQGATKYWYAFHPQWQEFLKGGKQGFFVLGCVDLDCAFALPAEVMNAHIDEFHTTERKDGSGIYYHIKIADVGDGRYAIQLPKSDEPLPLEPFALQLGRQSRRRRKSDN